jgi:hypothetical protein
MKRTNILVLLAVIIALAYSCSGKSETSENKGTVEHLSTIEPVEVDNDAMKVQAAELMDFVLPSIETGDLEGAVAVMHDAVSFKTDLINKGEKEAEKTYSEHLCSLFQQNKSVFERARSESQEFKEIADLLFAAPADTVK